MAMLRKEVHPQEVAELIESDLDQEIAGYVYIYLTCNQAENVINTVYHLVLFISHTYRFLSLSSLVETKFLQLKCKKSLV